MLNNEKIQSIAREQSALDMGCCAEDFLKREAVVVDLRFSEQGRVYFKEPVACNFVSYGSNVVAAARPEIKALAAEYTARYEHYHLFEAPHCLWLHERLTKYGYKIGFMAYYFLPDVAKLRLLGCRFEMRLLHPEDFEGLYTKEWSNALCARRRELDVLGAGAYDGNRLIGLAGCSRDCERMWQIGVDVLPEYRNQGVASALTSRLALEILARGRVPFYCCAWSNVASARNAVKSGFVPSWAEMSVVPADVADRANEVPGGTFAQSGAECLVPGAPATV